MVKLTLPFLCSDLCNLLIDFSWPGKIENKWIKKEMREKESARGREKNIYVVVDIGS